MNYVRKYREERGLTQTELADEINAALGTSYTTSMVSYAESDVMRFPKDVRTYIASKTAEKRFRNCSDARKGSEWVNTPPIGKKSLKQAILPNWNEKGLKQTERVLSYIAAFGSITTLDAFRDLGIARLASRIHDLTEEGYEFDKEVVCALNRYGGKVHFVRYKLKGDGDGKTDMG